MLSKAFRMTRSAALVLLVCGALSVCPVALAQLQFSAPTNYPLPNGILPSAVIAADFNGDGIPDLAVANLTDSVSIFLGNGDGTFQPAVKYLVGPPFPVLATSIAVGDFNGDQKADLAVVGLTGIVAVLLGNGDGTFQPPTQFSAGPQGSYITVGDFNNDGKVDLLVAAIGPAETISILLGKGDGTFQTPLVTHVASVPSVVAVGDFNGDGNLDVVTGPAVLLGKGDGTFRPPLATSLVSADFLAAGDFNGDGKLDLAAEEVTTTCNNQDVCTSQFELQTLLGNGNGTFGSANTLVPPTTIDGSVAGVAIADLNYDGKLGVAALAGNDGANYVLTFLGNGDGTFQPEQTVNVDSNSLGANWLAVADLTGDGLPDLVVLNTGDNLSVLLNTTPSPPSFVLSASAFTPTPVPAGSSTTATVSVKPTFGFNGTVTLSCTKLPSGASCSFSPQSIASSSGTSTLTVRTTSSAAVGTWTMNIQGSSSGMAHSTMAPLVVQAAPDFAISPASGQSTSQTISAGQSANFSLVLTPSGSFTGTVSLNCDITPAASPAPTCNLSSSSVQIGTGGGQTVTVTVKTTAPVTTASMSQVGFPSGWLLAWTGILFGSGLLSRRGRKRLWALAAPAVVMVVASWVGCGGGSSTSSQTTPGTPAGTYAATITATSGNLSHNTTLSLTVQ